MYSLDSRSLFYYHSDETIVYLHLKDFFIKFCVKKLKKSKKSKSGRYTQFFVRTRFKITIFSKIKKNHNSTSTKATSKKYER